MLERIRPADTGRVLRWAMAAFALACLVAACAAPDASQMLHGLWRICVKPAQLTKDFLLPEFGGVSGTMLNAALISAICCALTFLPGATVNGSTVLAFFLTVGFSGYGMSPLNLLPPMLGVWAYSLFRRQPFGRNINLAMFATGLSPFITQALFYYPAMGDAPRFTLPGLLLTLGIAVVVGCAMPALCAHSPNLHKGFNLYNAGPAAGMLGFALFSILYRTAGVEAPAAGATLGEGQPAFVNAFCASVFALFIAAGLLLNGGAKGYGSLLRQSGYKADFTNRPAGLCLFHVGVYGLFILAYYNLIGATFTGATFGAVLCMLACACAGATPVNVLPIMIGYFLASRVGATPLNAQGIVIGLCFASGLAPITGEFGWLAGILAGALHYCLVTGVPALHGGFCLYNGGFTAGFVCFILVPILEHFLKRRSERANP